MLSPYLKTTANFLLLDEGIKSLSDDELGFLLRAWAQACVNGGSIPTDPKQLGKLMYIRPTSAAKRMPLLKRFFTDFERISPEFLKEFQQFLKNLYQDFGKSQGRMYSPHVLESLGKYSKIVCNNRELSVQRGERKGSPTDQDDPTIRCTNRDTSITFTETNDVGSTVLGASEVDDSISLPGTNPGLQPPVAENAGPKAAKKRFPASYGKGSSAWKIAMMWNVTVKTLEREDLVVTYGIWNELGPYVVRSLGKHSEQDHLDAIAHVESWGVLWWKDAKMTFKSLLKKVGEYAEKQRSESQNPKQSGYPGSRPKTASPRGPVHKLRQNISGGTSLVARARAAADAKSKQLEREKDETDV